jgi:hypothetical protein
MLAQAEPGLAVVGARAAPAQRRERLQPDIVGPLALALAPDPIRAARRTAAPARRTTEHDQSIALDRRGPADQRLEGGLGDGEVGARGDRQGVASQELRRHARGVAARLGGEDREGLRLSLVGCRRRHRARRRPFDDAGIEVAHRAHAATPG